MPCVYVEQHSEAGRAAWAGEWPVYLPSGETRNTAAVGLGTGGFAQCLPDGNVIVIYTGCWELGCSGGESWDTTIGNHDLASQVCSNVDSDGGFYSLGLECSGEAAAGAPDESHGGHEEGATIAVSGTVVATVISGGAMAMYAASALVGVFSASA